MSHMKLYKNNVQQLRTSKVEEWKNSVQNTRRLSRMTLQFKNRQINLNDMLEESQEETLPSVTTPGKKLTTMQPVEPPKSKKDVKRERLLKWKEEKQKRKLLEAKKKRPAFLLNTKIIPDKPVFLHSEGSFKLPKIPEFKVPHQVQVLTKKWMNQFKGPKTRSQTKTDNAYSIFGMLKCPTPAPPQQKKGAKMDQKRATAGIQSGPTTGVQIGPTTDKSGRAVRNGQTKASATGIQPDTRRLLLKEKDKENLLHSSLKNSPYKLRESTVKGKDLISFNTP